MPPAKYLRLLRMQEARELLETTFLSVKEIRTRVGFGDESHFMRDFKKACGMTPAQYRQEYLRTHLAQQAPATRQQFFRADGTPARAAVAYSALTGHSLNATIGHGEVQIGLLGEFFHFLNERYAEVYRAAVGARYLLSHAVVVAHRALRPHHLRQPPLRSARRLSYRYLLSAQRGHFVTVRRPAPPKPKYAAPQMTYSQAALSSRTITSCPPAL